MRAAVYTERDIRRMYEGLPEGAVINRSWTTVYRRDPAQRSTDAEVGRIESVDETLAMQQTTQALERCNRALMQASAMPIELLSGIRNGVGIAEEIVREGARRLEMMAARATIDVILAPTSAASRDRARSLLLRFLKPEQREQHGKTGAFDHLGKYGTYTLRLGRSYNVRFEPKPGAAASVEDEKYHSAAVLCAIPAGAGEMPVEDILIAQLLWLRRDEDDFWWRANRGPGEMIELDAPGRTAWQWREWCRAARERGEFFIIDDPQTPTE
jgi:hypothetical protein